MLIGSEMLEVYRRSPTTARIADSLDKGVGRTRQTGNSATKRETGKRNITGTNWSTPIGPDVRRRCPRTANRLTTVCVFVTSKTKRKQCDKERNRKEKCSDNEVDRTDLSESVPPLSQDSEWTDDGEPT